MFSWGESGEGQDLQMEQRDTPISIFPGDAIVVQSKDQVEFLGQASCMESDLILFEWDFEGDGRFDFSSVTTSETNHCYLEPGFYKAVFRVTARDGRSAKGIREITVESPHLSDKYVSAATNLESVSELGIPIQPVRPGDGINTIYSLMITATSTFAIDPVRDMYFFLKDVHDVDPDNIIFLTIDDRYPESDNEIVDGLATQENVLNALQTLSEKMDDDDVFLWTIETHGSGYLGYDPENPRNVAYHGFFGVPPKIAGEGDERDYLERDIELSVLCANGLIDGRDFHYGLGEWGVSRHPGITIAKCARYLALSHFDSIEVDGLGVISDDDIYIEKFVDYTLGDLDKDGYIEFDSGEVDDWDGDGIPAYDVRTGTFDEDDWGLIDEFIDDLHYGHSTLCGVPFVSFDANFDNHIDVDINPGAVLEVDGTDFDNNGIIDGFDLNDDGDLDDWIAMDETMNLSDKVYTDDEVRVLLESFTNGLKIIIVNTCYSGGFVNDLSDAKTIVITGSREETASGTGRIFRFMMEGFTEYPYEADVDNNGRISIVEILNYSSLAPHTQISSYMVAFQYDDNGDKLSHEDPIPNGGDGLLGSFVYFERNTFPYFVSKSAVAAVVDSLFHCDITFADDDPGDSLSVSAESLPDWMSFENVDNEHAYIEGIPPEPGQYDVIITLRDFVGAKVTQTFTVDAKINNPPTIDAVPDYKICEFETLNTRITATDIDLPEQEITFSLLNAPEGVTIDPITGLLSWTPDETQGPGNYSFVVEASDGYDDATEEIFIQVNEVNSAPVFSENNDVVIVENEPVIFAVNAIDSDVPQQILSYKLIEAPEGAKIDSSTGMFSWEPDPLPSPGYYTFEVQVVDGVETSTMQFQLTILGANPEPFRNMKVIALDASTIRISFGSRFGWKYQIQVSDNLVDWYPSGNVVYGKEDNKISVDIPTDSTRPQYLRIVETAP